MLKEKDLIYHQTHPAGPVVPGISRLTGPLRGWKNNHVYGGINGLRNHETTT